MDWLKEIILNHGVALGLFAVSVVLIILGIRSNKNLIKQFSFNVAAVLIAVGIYELWPVKQAEHRGTYWTGSYAQDYFGDNDLLGYGPSADSMDVSSVMRFKDTEEVIYDVNYTIRNGMRYCPNSNDTSGKFAIFLGGSFMFGEGLNDDETIPYYYNEKSGAEYDIQNYGFHGYGPHQALAVVENKIITSEVLLNASEVDVYYLFLPTHIERAKGAVSWDQSGPRYEVVNDTLRFLGSFDGKRSKILRNKVGRKLITIWERSKIYNQFFKPQSTEDDLVRVGMIFDKMDKLLKDRAVRFSVVLSKANNVQDESQGDISDRMADFLMERGVNCYKIENVIPDYDNSGDKYIIKNEGHPNAIHNKLIGSFLAENKKG